MSDRTHLRLTAFSRASKTDHICNDAGHVSASLGAQNWTFGLVSLKGEQAPPFATPKVLVVTAAARAADPEGIDALAAAGDCVLVVGEDGTLTPLDAMPAWPPVPDGKQRTGEEPLVVLGYPEDFLDTPLSKLPLPRKLAEELAGYRTIGGLKGLTVHRVLDAKGFSGTAVEKLRGSVERAFEVWWFWQSKGKPLDGAMEAPPVRSKAVPRKPAPPPRPRPSGGDDMPRNTIDAAIRILEEGGSPMSATDIRLAVRKRWGIDYSHAIAGDRLCAVDRRVWGLAERDIAVDPRVRRRIVDIAVQALRARPMDAIEMHSLVSRKIPAWKGNPTLLATILRLDVGMLTGNRGELRMGGMP